MPKGTLCLWVRQWGRVMWFAWLLLLLRRKTALLHTNWPLLVPMSHQQSIRTEFEQYATKATSQSVLLSRKFLLHSQKILFLKMLEISLKSGRGRHVKGRHDELNHPVTLEILHDRALGQIPIWKYFCALKPSSFHCIIKRVKKKNKWLNFRCMVGLVLSDTPAETNPSAGRSHPHSLNMSSLTQWRTTVAVTQQHIKKWCGNIITTLFTDCFKLEKIIYLFYLFKFIPSIWGKK